MRDLRWDNARAVLIFLVVFGHLLELTSGEAARVLYQLIYTFHMPVFIFVTGYFAKFKPRAIVTLAACYVVFQTLYLLFDWGVLHGASGQLSLHYLEPYWLMWYLMATVFYYLLVPALSLAKGRWGLLVLLLCVAVSLLAGYAPFDRTLTLARFFAYLPCFAAGFYFRQLTRLPAEQRKQESSSNQNKSGGEARTTIDTLAFLRKPAVLIASAFLAFGGFGLLLAAGVSNEVLYNATPYYITWADPALRALQLVSSAGWCSLLLATASRKMLPVVTRVGQCTMPIFLLHGFIVRGLGMLGFVPFSQALGILCALISAAVIVAALGQPSLNDLLRFKLSRK